MTYENCPTTDWILRVAIVSDKPHMSIDNSVIIGSNNPQLIHVNWIQLEYNWWISFRLFKTRQVIQFNAGRLRTGLPVNKSSTNRGCNELWLQRLSHCHELGPLQSHSEIAEWSYIKNSTDLFYQAKKSVAGIQNSAHSQIRCNSWKITIFNG